MSDTPPESENTTQSNPVARQFALLMLFVILVTSGISLSATVAGNMTLTLQICGGGLGLAFIILLIGAFFAGKSRAE
jgi:hypothetical protein